jgi:membrane protein required for colicin V production
MDILSGMNWVDILVVIIVLRTVYVSMNEGLSREIFPLISSVACLVLAIRYYFKLGSMLHDSAPLIPLSIFNLVSFLAIAILSGFALNFVNTLINGIVKVTWHPFIERFGGILAGMLKGMVITSTVLILLVLIPLSYFQVSVKDRSLSGMFFIGIGPGIYRTIFGGQTDQSKVVDGIIAPKDIPINYGEVKSAREWERVTNVNKSGGDK